MLCVFGGKGVRVGEPRRATSRAGRSMETVQIDLSGLYEASIGGSVQLIIVVDSAWRRMRPHAMKSMAETTMFVHRLLTDMTRRNRAVSTRTTAESSSAAGTSTTATPPGSAACTRHRQSHSRTRSSRVRSGG